jgi:predicted enzyme related to lactoylglutathione lyase
LEKVIARAGKIAVEKHEIPGVGWLAYAKDPEGNIFGIIQPN